MYYFQQIKKKWTQFYKGEDYKKYSKAFQQISTLQYNRVGYQKNIIQEQLFTLQAQMFNASQQRKEQIEKRIQFLENCDGDNYLFAQQIKKIERKLSEDRINSHFSQHPQQSKLPIIEILKKTHGLRSFFYKSIFPYYQYQYTDWIPIFKHLSNLSYFSFGHQVIDFTQIKFSNVDELFNKKIQIFIDTNFLELQQFNNLKKQVSKMNRHFKFGCINVALETNNQNNKSLSKLKQIWANSGRFGLCLYLDQENQSSQLSQHQNKFIKSAFEYGSTRSNLLTLQLTGIKFPKELNQLLSQLFLSSLNLQQLCLQQCEQFQQGNFKNLNQHLTRLQLNNLEFKDNDGFKGICFSNLFKLQYLTIQQIQFSHQFFEYFSRNKVSFESTLIKLQMRLNSIGLLYNQQTRLFQDHSVKQFIEIFKNCSLHQLATECDYPEYLTRLQSDELTSLKLFQCHKLTQSSLLKIHRRWPNLGELILSSCQLQIKDWKIWKIFKTTQIIITDYYCAQKELKDLRLQGINIKLFEHDLQEQLQTQD